MKMNINKFKELCTAVEGFEGIVEQGNEIAIATTQKDMGENVEAVSFKPIEMFMKKCGIDGVCMPIPASNGCLIYVVRIWKR